MYMKDKNHRITLRLTDDQFNFVKDNCDVLGISPSDYLRMLVNSFIAASKMAQKATVKHLTEEIKKEGEGRENDKADCDNIV